MSELAYIPKLILHFEKVDIAPVPISTMGVEAHIIVGDFLTLNYEIEARSSGVKMYGSYCKGKVAKIDAIVSTIAYVALQICVDFGFSSKQF